ncbi:MAG TPA: glycosyltransferase family 87 protein [Ktedonobacterales bacterium]|jgi:hypothetical protein
MSRPPVLVDHHEQETTARVGRHSRRRRLLWAARTAACGILLALGLALLIQQVVIISHEPTDFCQEYIAAQRLAQGAPIYQPLQNSASYSNCPPSLTYDAHPPPTALLVYPLSFLPYTLASLIWGFCALAAYLASGLILLRALGWLSLAGVALFMIGSVYWQPVIGAEGAQNLWQFLALLIALAWILERRKRPGWAGGLLGLAGLLKIWPALLLLGGLTRHRWRLVLAGAAPIFLGTALALGVMGLESYAAYLGPVQASEGSIVPVSGNISLVGAVARLFSGDPPLLSPPIPGVSLRAATLLGEGAAGVVLLGALACIGWYRWRSPGEVTELLCQGLLVTVTLLVFPLIWYFGFITLLLPGATTILALRQLPRPPRRWFALLALSLLPLAAPYSLFTLGGWLLERHAVGSVWLSMGLFALPTFGLLLFAAVQGHLLHYASARRET